MPSLSIIGSNFIQRITDRNDDERLKAAEEFHNYLSCELNENSSEDVQQFLDICDRTISDLLSGSDPNDRKGGIFMMVCLIKEDKALAGNKFSRFANYLRACLPFNDISVMELAARTVGYLALAYGSYMAEYINFEIKRSFESLQSSEKNELRRIAAVLVLREIAQVTPTFFFQHIHQFFDAIFGAIKDQKCTIRVQAALALRAALVVTLQRETKQEQKDHWYKQCYEEAQRCFDEAHNVQNSVVVREERSHSALLVVNELLMISNLEGENMRQEIEEELQEKHPSCDRAIEFDTVNGSSGRRFFQHIEADNVHAWLLARRKKEIFESRTCRKHLAESFDKLTSSILKCRYLKQVNYSSMLEILPRLASFDSGSFRERHMNDAMSYVINCLTNLKEKRAAFNAVGLLCISCASEMVQFLPKIFDMIRQYLPSKDYSKKKVVYDECLFNCITLLVRFIGKPVAPHIKSILEPLFTTGLSFSSSVTLREIALGIPDFKKDIHDGLERQLYLILLHKPVPSRSMPPGPVVAPKAPISVLDPRLTVLALNTVSQFQFSSHSMETFLVYIAAAYLTSSHAVVRLQAVTTVAGLLYPFVANLAELRDKEQHLPLLNLVRDVIQKLLTVGVTDCDVSVRLCVFRRLMMEKSLHIHLAQADNLQTMFLALQDENFFVRETVLRSLGRLSDVNPAIIMPVLRRVLMQLIGELSYSGINRNEEQSARLLAQLVSSAPNFIKLYVPTTLKALVEKLKSSHSRNDVIINVLHATGELADVGGIELLKQRDVLTPILIDSIQDPYSLDKREVALWTFGQMIENIGYVVEPYQKYPDLLNILFRLLRTEQSQSIKLEAIRVLGFLGALDPHKERTFFVGSTEATKFSHSALSVPEAKAEKDPRQEIIQWFHWEKCTLEEFYPAFAVVNLMQIVADPSLSQHHTAVVQSVMFIFQSLGSKCLPYLDQVVPSFLNVIRYADSTFREFLFQQLGVLISVVKSSIKPYLKDIFALMKEFWTPQTQMKSTLIMLCEHLALALGAEFRPYLTELMPAILRVFLLDDPENRRVTARLLEGLKICGPIFEEHLHLIVPPIVRLFDVKERIDEISIELARSSIETLCEFADTMSLNQYSSRILHALLRAIDLLPEIRPAAFRLIRSLILQMGSTFLIFAPLFERVILKHKMTAIIVEYEALLRQLRKDGRLTVTDNMSHKRKWEKRAGQTVVPEASDTHAKKLCCNFALIEKSWNVSRCVSKEDWAEWLRRFSTELLKESPYPALRACWAVAQNHYPLAKELFNAAFISCWTELTEHMQNDLIVNLQHALRFEEGPEITQIILNLAEFMDHSEKGPLPVKQELLGERALKTRAYAKALRYMKAKFHESVTDSVLESLISINNKLQLHEASYGVVEYVKKREITMKIPERWYEKLHDWQRALNAYERKLEQDQRDIDLTLGQMRCLEALGEWLATRHTKHVNSGGRTKNPFWAQKRGKLNTIVSEQWDISSLDIKQKMAKIAAVAAWGEAKWENIDEYIQHLNENTFDSPFLRAVKCIHDDEFEPAQKFINSARSLISIELTSLAAESYNRTYSTMVTVQILSELEEAIQYKTVPEKRQLIAQMWNTRLKGCQNNVEDWQRLLRIRSLVLSPIEMRKTWIKFASLCRKNNKPNLAYKTLSMFGFSPEKTYNLSTALVMDKPDLTYAYCKQLWQDGKRDGALSQLKLLIDSALKLQILQRLDMAEQQELVKLKAKCYLKLGQWYESMRQDGEPPLLAYYKAATDWDRNWYKAWHSLACVNFSAILYYKQLAASKSNQTISTDQLTTSLAGSAPDLTVRQPITSVLPAAQSATLYMEQKLSPENLINKYAIQAVQCFFRSIALCRGNSLQDTLRLLTLWFDYGQIPEVYDTLVDHMKTVRIETWLQVVPQLIARIDTSRQSVSRLIMQLLMDVGKEHPQALVCPLTVAAKSNNKNRALIATRILNHIADHSPNLVRQASLLSEELIRVAILWHELWHEGLEEASRQYFAERNVQGMFNTLEPLHNLIEVGPTTLKEQSFTQAYLRDLKEAKAWCDKYKSTGNVKELTQAWDLYYNVFRRISKQLPQLTTLELNYVSPKLMLCQDMELAVPGTYDPAKPVIHIRSIHPSLQVITSKQRPRKVCIKGSDGNEYWFLLKGHEDPRQDERVMQLFGLINTLLTQDPATCRRNLTIQRYSVTPLSQNSGLIGWVPNCDTLHALLRDYRDKKKVLLNIEHKLMQRMAPDYDHLLLMEKVEVFEHALEHTSGDDLRKILWLKSPSSELWFDRRTSYTRSLAVMSMVGYILGLGDRHPSNLMLDRMSGKIVHIDFGDCFEVAMTREKFPEKIPFRLTRMLINAMEVTGIEGNFRITCERVMSVLRANKESLMAVLEAFVYDPLINWRLVEQCDLTKKAVTTPGVVDQLKATADLLALNETDSHIDVKKTNSRLNGSNANLNIVKDELLAVDHPTEVGSERALRILQRIRDKLAGRDFNPHESLDISTQVDLLIEQAISHENLCQCYIGWCPFW